MIDLPKLSVRAQLQPFGDLGYVIQLEGEEDCIRDAISALGQFFEKTTFPHVHEFVPAYDTVTLYMDEYGVPETVEDCLYRALRDVEKSSLQAAREVVIPVCYGGDLGPDLAEVAEHTGCTEEEVIQLHSAATYRVQMLGFAPGFPYLSGLPEELNTPRKRTPRMEIPAGSVGIAGSQTGVYSLPTPGGWQIIGRTPKGLFLPDENPPSLLRRGDIIRFQPITRDEWDEWEGTNR